MNKQIISIIIGFLISSNCLASARTHNRPVSFSSFNICDKAPSDFKSKEEKLKYLSQLEMHYKSELENFDNFNSIYQDAAKTRKISSMLLAGSISLLIPNVLNKASFFQRFFELNRKVFSKSGGLNLAKLDVELAAGYLGMLGLEFIVVNGPAQLALSNHESELFYSLDGSYKEQTFELINKLRDKLSTVSNCKMADLDKAVRQLRDEVFNNELNGSLYNGIQDHLTLGQLAARGSAKLVYLSYIKVGIIESQIMSIRNGL